MPPSNRCTDPSHTPADRPAPPQIQCFPLGAFETNCYIVRRPDAGTCWIIDAGDEPDELIAHARTAGCKPSALILTHAHTDHIAGIPDVLRAFPGLPVLIHEAERDWLADPHLNLSFYLGTPVSLAPPTRTLRDGEQLDLDGLTWEVRHTPGHSPGGVSFLVDGGTERVVVVGDVLFSGSIGRTDLWGGSFPLLERSIREQLYSLPDDTRVICGHGPDTTVGQERRTNPFVQG